MKKLLLTIFLGFFFCGMFAQELESSDIIIGLYYPIDNSTISRTGTQLSKIEDEILNDDVVRNILSNKLYLALTENGVASRGSEVYPQFILLPRLDIVERNLLPTAPPKYSVKMDLTLHLGNGFRGNKFKSHVITLVGVGTNQKRAHLNALNRFNPKSKEMQEFLAAGKQRIIDYFDNSCESLIDTAKSLKKQQLYEDAWRLLASIPTKAECYQNSETHLLEVYRNYLDLNCKVKMAEAKAKWSAGHDRKAAEATAEILAKINPLSGCFSQAERMFNEISETIKAETEEEREWNYKMRELDASKEIETARAEGQVLIVSPDDKGQYNSSKIETW